MNDALVVKIRGYWTAEWSKTSRSPKAHCRLIKVASIGQYSLSYSFIGCSGWMRSLSSSTLMRTIFIGMRLQDRNAIWHAQR
jgi:hypothetical protein